MAIVSTLKRLLSTGLIASSLTLSSSNVCVPSRLQVMKSKELTNIYFRFLKRENK